MTHEVINGATIDAPARTDEDRHVISPGVVLTVKPDGRTACMVRNGKKILMGSGHPPDTQRSVSLFVGEIDGVRTWVAQRDGKVFITMTRANMAV